MNRDQKAQAVERIAGEIARSDAIVALDYRGISVKQAADLRTALLDADASFRIVKNTLTERAADRAGAESLKELLEGPTALTFVHGDIAVAAKALATFRRREGVLEVKGGRMNGEPLSVEDFETIARLPALDALRGQFVGVLASPLTTLVRGLGSLISGLAVALRQVEEQGLVGGGGSAGAGAPAAEAEAPADTEAQAADAAAPAEAGAPEPEAAPAEPAEGEPSQAEAPEPEAAGEPGAEAPEEPASEQPSEAPGDPVAEAEAAEETSESTPSEGGRESEEG